MVRSHTLKEKIKLVSSYVSRGTILDYGCGTGMFLSECKKAGWETFGMEPDDSARQIASEKNLNLFADKNTLQLHLAEKEFDAITLWHVLEHITDMFNTLAFFKHKLKSNGVLIIAVPNHKSYDAEYYKEYWAAYDVPRHLHHFELKSMKSLLENSGFQLIETRPMKFDSFYVSMLSEKYKTGSVNLAQAFKIGATSNMKAKDSSSYSSTIYIFQHK
jgi:2-polyprenyl-3-methyl-5-hydroxy-6-metoxy-1,4-benzoquinol methylase